MDARNQMAHRYHWLSENFQNFVREPHTGIIRDRKNSSALDMVAQISPENQKVCVNLAKGDITNLKTSVYKLGAKDTLDPWIGSKDIIDLSGYEMPRRLDWSLFKRIYNIQPKNSEELQSISGVGAATIRALSLIAELICGAPAS